MLNFIKSKQLLERSESIAIFTHANADGDAIGSAFAFYYYLTSLGKKVDVFSDSETLPNQLSFLNIADILNKKTVLKYDLAVATDTSTLDLLGKNKQNFLRISNSIQFDHHLLNPNFARVNNISTNVSSACELVADFFYKSNIKITKRIGQLLLSGIVTDSGGFKFSCTTNKTMEIVSKILKETKIELSSIMSNLFESETMDSFLMQKEAYNHTEFLKDNKIAIIKLDYNFYKTNGVDPNACKFLTRIGTELKDVVLTALVSEVEPNVIKVSFRSRMGYDASKCARCFGGGGHKQASGCKIFGSFNEAVYNIKNVLMDELR